MEELLAMLWTLSGATTYVGLIGMSRGCPWAMRARGELGLLTIVFGPLVVVSATTERPIVWAIDRIVRKLRSLTNVNTLNKRYSELDTFPLPGGLLFEMPALVSLTDPASCPHAHVRIVDRWYGHGRHSAFICDDCSAEVRPRWDLVQPPAAAPARPKPPQPGPKTR